MEASILPNLHTLVQDHCQQFAITVEKTGEMRDRGEIRRDSGVVMGDFMFS